MNSTQMKHARERASKLLRVKKDKLAAAYNEAGKGMSREDIHTALMTGSFTFKKKPEKGAASTLATYIEFPQDAHVEAAQKTWETGNAALQAAYDKLIDDIVLGEGSEVLSLLKAFEAL